jgi:hypothetical protein
MTPERRFAYRLALALDQPNVDAMLSRITWRQWQEWQQFCALEPFGELPLRIGYVGAALGNLLGKPKFKRHWEPGDFMPYGAPEKQEAPARTKPSKSADAQLAHILMVSQQMGWTVIDKRKDKQRARDD